MRISDWSSDVCSSDLQADRVLYKAAVREILENQPNLWIFQQAADDLIVEQDQVRGVVTQMGLRFFADSVVLTTGTFLGGLIHIGLQNFSGGRAGDPPSIARSEEHTSELQSLMRNSYALF